jgi:hypothetical protein
MTEEEGRKAFLDGKPFTALFTQNNFYLIYRLGGARSIDYWRQEILVFREPTRHDALSFYDYTFANTIPENYVYVSREERPADASKETSVLFIPYHNFSTRIDEDEDMEENEIGEFTTVQTRCATIMNLDHHLLFDGSDFILPHIWGSELDDEVTIEIDELAGMTTDLTGNGEFI